MALKAEWLLRSAKTSGPGMVHHAAPKNESEATL
jgi:hypothetical protein